MTLDVVVIGSGFAGIGMGYHLKKAGFQNFRILERAGRVGGTWRDNYYPGAACDIQSHLYSFSFAPHPGWSRTYAPQSEILAYLERCVEDFGLGANLRLNCGVQAAVFNEATKTWMLRTSEGEIAARFVISAAGHALTTPIYPAIPGRESFRGPQFHSARWGGSLEGKRVGVIGTGASAIQIVPALAPTVASLRVFQRTPPWILPRRDQAIPEGLQTLYRRAPLLQKLVRGWYYLRHEMLALGFVREPRLLRLASGMSSRFLEKQVKDRQLRERLRPHYTMGCKRVLLSDDYYPAVTRNNVALVTESIRAVTPEGVVTADGVEHPLDALVYATGFEAAEAHPPFSVKGLGGMDLEAWWGGVAQAYLGTAIARFPNLFLLLGPNTGLGHNSMIYMIESQIAYLIDALRTFQRQKIQMAVVKDEVVQQYNQELQEKLGRTVWQTGGCQSWYRTADGRNTTLWPGFTYEFRRRTARFDPDAYEMHP